MIAVPKDKLVLVAQVLALSPKQLQWLKEQLVARLAEQNGKVTP